MQRLESPGKACPPRSRQMQQQQQPRSRKSFAGRESRFPSRIIRFSIAERAPPNLLLSRPENFASRRLRSTVIQ